VRATFTEKREARRIDAQFFRDHLRERVYLIAGPPPMVEAITAVLAEAGVPEDGVVPERYSGY
jgi:ferredoxin-NADP reductase